MFVSLVPCGSSAVFDSLVASAIEIDEFEYLRLCVHFWPSFFLPYIVNEKCYPYSI